MEWCVVSTRASARDGDCVEAVGDDDALQLPTPSEGPRAAYCWRLAGPRPRLPSMNNLCILWEPLCETGEQGDADRA